MVRKGSSGPRLLPAQEGRFSVVPCAEFSPSIELEKIGIGELTRGGARVAVKPNLTWAEPRPGVTTSVEATQLIASSLIEAGNQVTIMESDGGYGTFSADTAFASHGLDSVASEIGADLINLSKQPTRKLLVGGQQLDLPVLLLDEVDWIVSIPVPKVHVLTRYTGAIKNQWGLIPTDMRLRLHYRIDEILSDLLTKLPPQAVFMDGSYFLDVSGPIEGRPVARDIMITANHPVVADVVALRLMGWEASEVSHVRRAARRLGFEVEALDGLPSRSEQRFTLKRTFWNWVALAGFHSRLLTYAGYESPLAKPLRFVKVGSERLLRREVVLHRRSDKTKGRNPP
jgi:uncharacterized protein (DUF362 family)